MTWVDVGKLEVGAEGFAVFTNALVDLRVVGPYLRFGWCW
jgi:hypothetical protein